MMTLFNREQVLEAYIEDERRQAAEAATVTATIAATNAKAIEDARQMKAHGISDELIASIMSKPLNVIQGWLAASAN